MLSRQLRRGRGAFSPRTPATEGHRVGAIRIKPVDAHSRFSDPDAMDSPFTVFSDGFTDDDAAELYDVLCPWDVTSHPENAFVLGLVQESGSVLDVGCG